MKRSRVDVEEGDGQGKEGKEEYKEPHIPVLVKEEKPSTLAPFAGSNSMCSAHTLASSSSGESSGVVVFKVSQCMEVIRCDICLEVWTSPQVLACGHVFCAGCLVMVDKCSLCSKPIDCPSIPCIPLRELACCVVPTPELKAAIMKESKAKMPRNLAPSAESMIEYARRMDEKVANETVLHLLNVHLKWAIDIGKKACRDECACKTDSNPFGRPQNLLLCLPDVRQTRAKAILTEKGYHWCLMGIHSKRKGVDHFKPGHYNIGLTAESLTCVE